jgi:hypothetical protein
VPLHDDAVRHHGRVVGSVGFFFGSLLSFLRAKRVVVRAHQRDERGAEPTRGDALGVLRLLSWLFSYVSERF